MQGAFNASKDNPIREFDIGTKDATFLFDTDIAKYVEDVRNRINKLIFHAKSANHDPLTADHQTHVDREHQLYLTIVHDLETVQEKFTPYLNFKKLNTFW